MAVTTWTFNQPSVKLILPDDYAVINGDNPVIIDIRNTGINYIAAPTMYSVVTKDGYRPGTHGGIYLTLSEADMVAANIIATQYGGQQTSLADKTRVTTGAFILSTGSATTKNDRLENYQSGWFTEFSSVYNNNKASVSGLWLTVYHQTNPSYRYAYMISDSDSQTGYTTYVDDGFNFSLGDYMTHDSYLNYVACSNFNPNITHPKTGERIIAQNSTLYNKISALQSAGGNVALAISQIDYNQITVNNVETSSAQFYIDPGTIRVNGSSPDIIITSRTGISENKVYSIIAAQRSDGDAVRTAIIIS